MEDLSELAALSAKIIAAEAKLAKDKARRTELASAARRDGWPWDQIEKATQLTRATLNESLKRANGGVLPIPRQRGRK
jgi:hypothetical protein